MISNKLLNEIAQAIANEASYIGLGTGVVPVETDILLNQEQIRSLGVSIVDENTVIVEVFFSESEANGVNYINTGLFDSTATATINTGQLLAGFAINVTKTNIETFTLSYEITVDRGV